MSLFGKYCKEFIRDSIPVFTEISLKYPVQKKEISEFIFKNGQFQKEKIILKNDYSGFFLRSDVRMEIENIQGFKILYEFLTAKKFMKQNNGDPDTYLIKNKIFLFLENFVAHYLDYFSGSGSIEYNVNVFNAVEKQFKKHLFDDINSTSHFTPLYNFKSEKERIDFIDFVITRITSDRFRIIKENLVGKFPTPSKMYRLTHVLETKTLKIDDYLKEENYVKEKFQQFIESARIFQTGDVQIGGIYSDFTQWNKTSYTRKGNDDSKASMMIYDLGGKKIPEFKKFYSSFSQINLKTKEWAFLERAINRFDTSSTRNTT